jgi:hypothetical protein
MDIGGAPVLLVDHMRYNFSMIFAGSICTAHQTGCQERKSTIGKGKRNCEEALGSYSSQPDFIAQSCDSGLGYVPPVRTVQIPLYIDRCSNLAPLMDMGIASASLKRQGLGKAKIFPRRGGGGDSAAMGCCYPI